MRVAPSTSGPGSASLPNRAADTTGGNRTAVITLASVPECGAARNDSLRLRKPPPQDRDPVRFWQVVSLILGLALLLSSVQAG